MIRRLDDILKNESGSGMGVVIYGIVIMLVLSLVSINILNAKIIQDGYDRLRDSVEAAAAGSVLHIALDSNQESTISGTLGTDDGYQLNYDPWLQLALGFLMQSDKAPSGSNSNSALGYDEFGDENKTIANDYIKFDRKRVATHTMKILQDGILKNTEDITDFSRYKIHMVFLEPAYDDDLDKSIDIISYNNTMFDYPSLQPNSDFKGDFYSAGRAETYTLDRELIGRVEDIINSNILGNRLKVNLQADPELVEQLQTRPYYFIIIEDFALPTLFGDTRGNIFNSITQESGRVSMFALQGANTNRKIDEDDEGIK